MFCAPATNTVLKGKTFEIPELVPFRLTQNFVDALGLTGVEGKADVITPEKRAHC